MSNLKEALNKLKLQFLQETEEMLDHVSENILKAEKGSDNTDILNSIFRDIHTIKGSAGGFDFDQISLFAHNFEELLDALRKKEIELNSEIVDIILFSVDTIAAMIQEYQQGQIPVVNYELAENLKQITQRAEKKENSNHLNETKTSTEKANPHDWQDQGKDPDLSHLTLQIYQYLKSALEIHSQDLLSLYCVKLNYTSEYLENGFDPAVLLSNLQSSSTIYYAVTDLGPIPFLDDFHEYELILNPTLFIASSLTKDEIKDLALDPSWIDVYDIEPEYRHYQEKFPEYTSFIGAEKEIPGADLLKQLDPNLFVVFFEQAEQYCYILMEFIHQYPQKDQLLPIYERILHSFKQAANYIQYQPIIHKLQQCNAFLKQKQYLLLNEEIDKLYSFTIKYHGHINQFLHDLYRKEILPLVKTSKFYGRELYPAFQTTTVKSSNVKKLESLSEESNKLAQPTTEKDSQTSLLKTMRVDSNLIDTLVTVSSELIILRNNYEFLIDRIRQNPHFSDKDIREYQKNFYLFSRLTKEIQEELQVLNRIPLKEVFKKFSRILRDTSISEKKQITLKSVGEMVEVDKSLAFMLSNFLIELIQSICHSSIEPAEERIRNGKNSQSILTIENKQVGKFIHIKCREDGNGLDRSEIQKLIKKHELEAANITYQIQIYPGLGSEIQLTFSVLLGVTSALIVSANQRHYAIPLESIHTLLVISSSNLQSIHDRWATIHKEELIPVQSLDELLFKNYQDSLDFMNLQIEQLTQVNQNSEVLLVVLNTSKGKYGVIIDRFLKQVEISHKPVPPIYQNIPFISGISTLGNGEVILILNFEGLV